MKNFRFYIYCFALIGCLSAKADWANTDTLQFYTPKGWNCGPNPPHYLCSPPDRTQGMTAIFIVTEGAISKGETLSDITDEFRKPRMIVNNQGKSIYSKVYHTKSIIINDVTWINSLHFNGEIENFFTNFYFTIHKDRFYLINISGHKDHYSKFQPHFNQLIKSLRFKEPTPNLKAAPIPTPTNEPMASETNDIPMDKQKRMILFVVILVVGAFTIIKLAKKFR